MIKIKVSKDNVTLVEKTFDQRKVTLGRSIDCDIVIDDTSVSPLHASFDVKKGRLRVKDEGSVNGVWHRKKRIVKKKFNSIAAVRVSHKYDIELDFEDLEWVNQKHDKKEQLEYLIKTFDLKKYLKQIGIICFVLIVALVLVQSYGAFRLSRLSVDKDNVVAEAVLDRNSKENLIRAKDYYFNGEYVLAASEFSKVLNKYPAQEEALNYSQQIKSDYAPQIDQKFADLVEYARYDEAIDFIRSVKSVLGSDGTKFYSEILNGQKKLVEGEDCFRKGEYKRALKKINGIKVLDHGRLERLSLYAKSAIEFKQELLVVNSMINAQEFDDAKSYMEDVYGVYKNILAERLKDKYQKQYKLLQVLSKMQTTYSKGYNTTFLTLYKKASEEFGLANPAIVGFMEKAQKIEAHIKENIDVLKADANKNIKRLYDDLHKDQDSMSAWKDYYTYLSKLELYQIVKTSEREKKDNENYRSFFDNYIRDLYDEAYVLDSFGKTDESRIVYEKILAVIDESSKYYSKVQKKYKKYL